MKTFLKLMFFLLITSFFISCSFDKKNNESQVIENTYFLDEKNSSIDYMVSSSYVLPPLPNKKDNDKTLLGIDSNHNGIRDDMEHYIW